jgi:D-tyrosyl-tRNA(Tyr) deacylase
MRVVVQRVTEASVRVGGKTVASIGPGLVLLVGVAPTDTKDDVAAMSAKLVSLRIFRDAIGKMNHSIVDIAGEILVVSQFTLLADVRRGRRPSFTGAGAPEFAEPLVGDLVGQLRGTGISVRTGSFGMVMQVALINDGPVTIVIDAAGGRIL